MNEHTLVIFGNNIPNRDSSWWKKYTLVIAPKNLEGMIFKQGVVSYHSLESYKEAGSIYEGTALVEELSHLELPGGEKISKSAMYKGYELWWIHYTDLFLHFTLPYTQYRKLLLALIEVPHITLYDVPFEGLFRAFLMAYEKKATFLSKDGFHMPKLLPFGIMLQILLSVLYIPWIAFRRHPIMVFIGDKFDGKNDYDFRMKFIYEALRSKGLPFVEFIRSIQPWKTVLQNAERRSRPVLYATGVMFVARYVSILTGGRRRAMKRYDVSQYVSLQDKHTRFKCIVASQYLLTSDDEVWEIRIMRILLRMFGVKAAFIASGSERNFTTLLACKLLGIHTVGILHGVASHHYNVYEFMPGYTGKQSMSVDTYGVWSDWWREYFIEHSKVYTPQGIFVSGPMRPLIKENAPIVTAASTDGIRVLFVSEEMAVPEEVLPYLESLLQEKRFSITMKLRPHRDGFETWLMEHRPDFLSRDDLSLVRGSMQEAISSADVVVGCQSTGVLEAVLLNRVPFYFNTGKWGDYFSLRSYNAPNTLFAENPQELISKITRHTQIDQSALSGLRERYFGDPYKNGSAWAVDELEKAIT